VRTLSKKFGNIFVAATKLTKAAKMYKHYSDNLLKPLVKKDTFMLILDSCGGQTNPALHDEKNLDENELTCSLKIITPECTLLCQPCFY
jgi:hypothetical protein